MKKETSEVSLFILFQSLLRCALHPPFLFLFWNLFFLRKSKRFRRTLGWFSTSDPPTVSLSIYLSFCLPVCLLPCLSVCLSVEQAFVEVCCPGQIGPGAYFDVILFLHFLCWLEGGSAQSTAAQRAGREKGRRGEEEKRGGEERGERRGRCLISYWSSAVRC